MSSTPDLPPPSSSRPQLGEGPAPASSEPVVAPARFAPEGVDDLVSPAVTPAMVHTYLSKRSTLSLIARVVRCHVARKTPKHVREAIASDAQTRMLESKWLPISEAAMDGWLTTLTSRAVVDYFRRQATDLRWLRREVLVEDQPGEAPEEEVDPNDGWLLTNWLRERVQDDPADRELFELILLKARSEKSYEELAAERGIAANTLTTRIYRFKLKYVPIRHRHEEKRNRMIALLVLAFVIAAAIAAIAAYAMGLSKQEGWAPPATRRTSVHPVRVVDDPPVFNQAAPTGGKGP